MQHVRGHQDDDTAYVDLPLPAQLNVDADLLASEYEFKMSQCPTRVPLITGNTVQLHHRGRTITSNLKRTVRRLATEPALINYIEKKNSWDNGEFSLVDWDSHGVSLQKHYHIKHFIVKFVHDWLPVGKLIARYGQFFQAKCPSCDYAEEDRSHFLLCPSRPWVPLLIRDIRGFCSRFPTRPALQQILIEGLQAWSSQSHHVFTSFPQLYNALIRNQSKIGWDQILLGRFVLEWRELQDDFLCTYRNKKKQHTGLTWVTGVTQIIWRHVYQQWEKRNKAQHGEDRTQREQILIDRAKRATAALYEVRHNVLPRDRDCFYSTLEEHYEYERTSTGLNQWLRTWKPVILQSIKQSATRSLRHLRGVSSIRSYFS